MLAPQRYGLFTLCEVDENLVSSSEDASEFESHFEPASVPRLTSTALINLNVESPTPDFPSDIDCDDCDEDMLDYEARRLSWSTAGSQGSETDIATPDLEEECPPFFEYTWLPAEGDSPAIHLDYYDEDAEVEVVTRFKRLRQHRPRPLDLAEYHHPFSAASLALNQARALCSPTLPSGSRLSLLPALPIEERDAEAYRYIGRPTTPNGSRCGSSGNENVNLSSALEDFLTSCEEAEAGPSSDPEDNGPTMLAFPLPPAHLPSPRTPSSPNNQSPQSLCLCPPLPASA
ncbi:MAG: hypothetical protein TREMPRED_001580 [Tremellales sp. Tagirdzhanova-0007]|nr:MAG: hypothetical protein TREMPRED_001580 [Tremellales sp. Tagirdzhanova-0007]